ncbi:MAG: helix-turn-helix domain-containing protein [Bacillota bacterium]
MSIGDRLKMARRASGLSMRALGAKANLSAQAISKYERNLDIPGSGALIRLSHALGVRPEYFHRPSSVELSVSANRAEPCISAKASAAIIEQAREVLERFVELEYLFAEQVSTPPFPADLRMGVQSVEQVEGAVEQLRCEWGLGLDPLSNLTAAVEDHGIRVVLVKGSPDFDACIVESSELGPVIVLKKGVPGDRQRFSLAHELGHLLLQIGEGVDHESACNRFAGAFLVPRERVRSELGLHRDALGLGELELLKLKYGLSMQSWIHRAQESGVLSERQARRQLREFKRNGWKATEPGVQVPPEEALRANLLVERALAEGLISRSRAAELAGKPLSAEFKGHAW